MNEENKKHNQKKQQNWHCLQCSHKLANLANESIVIFYKEGREFYITYDHINTNCPQCDSLQIKESPFLKTAIKEIRGAGEPFQNMETWQLNPLDELITNIRLKAWGIKNREDFNKTFPLDSVVLPSKERSKFITLLSEKHRKVYKTMCDTFNGVINDSQTMKAIKERLDISLDEAKYLYSVVLDKLRDFRHNNQN